MKIPKDDSQQMSKANINKNWLATMSTVGDDGMWHKNSTS
jgi:hypothetical protein